MTYGWETIRRKQRNKTMKRILAMAMVALLVPTNPTGTAQDGYTFVQQCNGPNCVVQSRPILRMPVATTLVPVHSPPSVTYYELPEPVADVSPVSTVYQVQDPVAAPVQYSYAPVSQVQYSYSAPVASQTVKYSNSPVLMQQRPLILPRLFPRARANMRNRRAMRRSRWNR